VESRMERASDVAAAAAAAGCCRIRSLAPIAISRLRVLINPNCTKRTSDGGERGRRTEKDRSRWRIEAASDFTSPRPPSPIHAIRERDSILSCRAISSAIGLVHTSYARIQTHTAYTHHAQRELLRFKAARSHRRRERIRGLVCVLHRDALRRRV